MTSRKLGRALTHEDLERIIQRYETDELRWSTTYGDAGIDPLWGRFARAVSNQIDGGDATTSRYAIWANTVRDNIVQAIELLDAGKKAEAKRLLTRGANSLSAFSDVQAYFDPFEMGVRQ